MKKHIKISTKLIFTFLIFSLNSCSPDDDTTYCEKYPEDCAYISEIDEID